MTENGRTFVRQYLLDFGSALGSAGIGPRLAWEGEEPLVEPRGEIGKRVLSFGFRIPEWRTAKWYQSPAVGRLPRSHASWNPEAWQPHVMNQAFANLRPDDAFWAAEKLTAITDPIIAAAVAEGRFDNAEAEGELARVIRERRDRILQTYLPAINPITRPELTADGLRFSNAAVDAHVAAAPAGYRAEWGRFDNATGTVSPLGETTAAASPLPVLDLGDAPFIQVRVSATGASRPEWERPVAAFPARQRSLGSGWSRQGAVRREAG